MQDLIKQIVEKTGVPEDKAQQVLGVIGNFIKEKFPMMAGQVDSLLGTGGAASSDTKSDSNDLLGGLGSKFGL